jgi:hypothetical protein
VCEWERERKKKVISIEGMSTESESSMERQSGNIVIGGGIGSEVLNII